MGEGLRREVLQVTRATRYLSGSSIGPGSSPIVVVRLDPNKEDGEEAEEDQSGGRVEPVLESPVERSVIGVNVLQLLE